MKLIDFGLSVRARKQDMLDFAKCGTLLYYTPEQVRNNYAYSKKTDMWAAGILLFELIYGQHPFDKDSSRE